MRLSVVLLLWSPGSSGFGPPGSRRKVSALSRPGNHRGARRLLCSTTTSRYAEQHTTNRPKVTGMSPKSAATATLLLGLLITPGSGRAQAPDSLVQVPDSLELQSPIQAGQDVQGQAGEPANDSIGQSGDNPFAGFETHFLANGLKVWYKHLPDAPNVSVSVAIPFGSHSDPRGKEGLAHFAEHMLFSDHEGRSEREVKDAIESLGGRRNGFTAADHTWYYATIDKQHGLFAIEWLSRIVSPHSMAAEVVERNRQPIAIETNAAPREVFEHVWAFLNPSLLLPPDFWQREYGMDTRGLRPLDRWARLQGITPEDLRSFYDTYYVPAALTLTIVGDMDRDQALAMADSTFGVLPRRTVPPREIAIEDPNRRRATYLWGFQPNVRYTARYKFFHASAEDELMILFTRDLLNRRLNQRLRYGDQKAVYSIQVASSKRGPAAFLQVRGLIDENEYDFAFGVIEEEIQSLRTGALDPAAFEADRSAVIEGLRSGNQTSQALNFWVYRNFYDPDTYSDFPDVLGFYEDVSQEAVASFAARNLVAERQVLSVLRRHPISQELIVVALLGLIWATVRIVGWSLTSSVTMKDIRYVARFRVPVVFRIVAFLVLGGAGLVLARVTFFGFQWLTLARVVTVDDYTIQTASYALMLVSVLTLFLLYLSRLPRKLLVFPDHLRVKSLAYRSRIFKPEDLEEISLRRFHKVWLRKDLFSCFPMTVGLLRPGIYLRPVKGRAYFFRSRDSKELIEVLGVWRGEPITTAIPEKQDDAAPKRSDPTTSEAPEGTAPKAATQAQSEGPDRATTKPSDKVSPKADAAPKPTTPPATAEPGSSSVEANHDDVDFDSIGLTEAEMEELLGETRRDGDPTGES